MGRKLYVLKMTAAERSELESVVKRGRSAAWKVQRAQALLQCDQGEQGPGWTDEDVASAYDCTTRSLENWRSCRKFSSRRNDGVRIATKSKPASTGNSPPKTPEQS